MTASQVDGVQVVATEAVPTKWIDTTTGRPRMYRALARLLLEDGRELHGCTRCTYTAEKATSVAAHQRSHSVAAKKEAVAQATAQATAQAAAAPPPPTPPAPTAKRPELPAVSLRGRPAVGDRARAVRAEHALFRIRDILNEVLG